MQRIGRVNRIGSESDSIYNYVFYPSREGDQEIKLNRTALSKIQTFHSTFGEDNQIYSAEEILDYDLEQLFSEGMSSEEVNEELPFFEEIRDLYNRRWGIETSFRDIKYAAGMLFFHSRKKQLVLQEIYAKLILYNFSEAITRGIVTRKAERKYMYSINFALAISLCVEFLWRCKQKNPMNDLENVLTRYLIPIRPGRSSPRYIRARTATSFLYR